MSLRHNVLVWFIRIALGGTFVLAGVLKISDPARFASAVDNYRFAPHELVNFIAIVVPWIEVVAGLCLVTGIWLRPGAIVVMILTGMFLLVVSSALARGLNIECGCFGTISSKNIGLQHLAIDFALFFLAVLLFARTRERPDAGKVSGGSGTGKVSVPALQKVSSDKVQ